MTEPALRSALFPVLDALDSLGVRHYVGGSLASSAHGIPRASIDADLVADLRPPHVARLAEALRKGYYVPEERMRDAVARHTSFNLIHLESMFKVDVFVAKPRRFDHEALGRARVQSIGGREVPVASPEDIVLAKLEWYRKENEVSERQWGDVLGVLRAAEGGLDAAYLHELAAELEVADLLARALSEAGAGP